MPLPSTAGRENSTISSHTAPNQHNTIRSPDLHSTVRSPRAAKLSPSRLRNCLSHSPSKFGHKASEVQPPLAGRVVYNWKRITSDPWILQTVADDNIELLHRVADETLPDGPQLDTSENNSRIQCNDHRSTDSPVKEHSSCSHTPRGPVHKSLFLVTKKDGRFQPVVNLNCFIQKQHFKMEEVSMLKDILQQEDWICSVDLKNAYVSVSVSDTRTSTVSLFYVVQQDI